MAEQRITFRVHAVRRMFERRISAAEVRRVIQIGETIASYPDDQPYPSRPLLGWPGDRPLHVLVADSTVENRLIVVTVYEPDPSLWDDSFRRRRKR